MQNGLKLAIVGAGSTYTPELADGILRYGESLGFGEIWLMDIDEKKNRIVGGLFGRILAAGGLTTRVHITGDLDKALAGADFVIAQLRVGRLAARVLDETIPLKHGFIGQETTGMGGFFKALRTIPAMLHIARRMEALCPRAFLINFTNPSGIVTQALLDHSGVNAIGLCNVPINMVADLAANLGLPGVEVEYLGLNHVSWVTKILAGGKDHLPEAIRRGINAAPMKNIQASGFSKECLAAVGAIPSSYLEYFYNPREKLRQQQAAEQCRGVICQEQEEELLALYADSGLHEKPGQLENRGGARYSEAAVSLVNAIANNTGETHILDVYNRDALGFMGPTDVVEVACHVGAGGARPIPLPGFDNPHIIAMMRQLKAYERHTVAAAVQGSETEAMRALLANPLTSDFGAAQACFREMLAAHAAWLPGFGAKGGG